MKNKEPDKLAQDVHCAIAAGMSYGQYMAMKKPTSPAARKIDKKTGVCVWCGKTFIQAHSNKKKYCDEYCKEEAARARERQHR